MMRRRTLLVAAAASPLLGGCGREPLAGGFIDQDQQRGHAWRDGALAADASAAVRRTRVLIAGAGIAGLAAARALRLRGIDDFAVLDLADQAGGNSRAAAVQGIACPLGAHYLPLPRDTAFEVQDLLEELGLRTRRSGRWVYDERHLCHSPQERLFFRGHWQDGLLPADVPPSTQRQYQSFAARVRTWQATGRFEIPAWRRPPATGLAELDELTFAAWLGREGFDDPHLRWYLEYCCRDDYGAGCAQVSAWAGLHYFASRHGFTAPGAEDTGHDTVLTWPEGNGWLVHALRRPLGERLHTGQLATRIAERRDGVHVEAFDFASARPRRWLAERCILALPMFVAARLVENPPPLLREEAAVLRSAPWLVANLHIREPLDDRPGPAPSWDNVVYDTPGLGYVDARHQSLDPTPGPTVLTWYRPLGPSRYDGPDGRRLLHDRPWTHWLGQLRQELAGPHPDLADKATHLALVRHGHAMAYPQPGLLRRLARRDATGASPVIKSGRLLFAHADWSGYSIFEEAFSRGHWAGSAA